MGKPTGVMLLAFGGPDSPEAIEPFMTNLMGGRVPPPALVEKVKARYALIGGSSPLPGITAAQAADLEALLNQKGGNFRVVVGMRYWHPFIGEGLKVLLEAGVERIVAVSLAPFYSGVSTGAYEEELKKTAASAGDKCPKITMAEPLYSNPVFIEAVADKVSTGLAAFPAERRQDVQVIFSAHSLPVSGAGVDLYAEQFRLAVQDIVNGVGLAGWHLAYQSKGGGQGEWLGPMVEEIMDELKAKGLTDVLVVPVGFVSDHIETLYDIDIAQKKHAEALGLNFHRTSSLNTSDQFIRALAEAVSGAC